MWVSAINLRMLTFYFKDKLKSSRFDGIASGIQRFVEDRV